MAVTMLVRVAAALNAPMSFFFEGVGPQIDEPGPSFIVHPWEQHRDSQSPRSISNPHSSTRKGVTITLKALAKSSGYGCEITQPDTSIVMTSLAA